MLAAIQNLILTLAMAPVFKSDSEKRLKKPQNKSSYLVSPVQWCGRSVFLRHFWLEITITQHSPAPSKARRYMNDERARSRQSGRNVVYPLPVFK